jgi:hypothetical protein
VALRYAPNPIPLKDKCLIKIDSHIKLVYLMYIFNVLNPKKIKNYVLEPNIK